MNNSRFVTLNTYFEHLINYGYVSDIQVKQVLTSSLLIESLKYFEEFIDEEYINKLRKIIKNYSCCNCIINFGNINCSYIGSDSNVSTNPDTPNTPPTDSSGDSGNQEGDQENTELPTSPSNPCLNIVPTIPQGYYLNKEVANYPANSLIKLGNTLEETVQYVASSGVFKNSSDRIVPIGTLADIPDGTPISYFGYTWNEGRQHMILVLSDAGTFYSPRESRDTNTYSVLSWNILKTNSFSC